MALLRTSNAPIGLNRGKPISTETNVVGWQAPSDWLTFTVPGSSEQKLIGTVAVFDQDSNYLAVSATTTDASQFTVDWGDGTSANFASGTTAEKNYTWASISAGTLTSKGYRQAIVTITPTTAGRTFATVSPSRKHSAIAASSPATSPWLNIAISAPNATTIDFGSGGQPCALAEQVQIVSSNITSASSLFTKFYALQNVIFNTSGTLTSTQSMFQDCRMLRIPPFFNTASVTQMGNMFNGCFNLQSVPLYNTILVQSMSGMFTNCSSLTTVPLFNTAACTNMSSMFNNCVSLESVPLFNTASVTTMSSMFASCDSLKSVPLFNTAAVTNMSSMFFLALSIKTVPLFNTAAVTNMTSMFFGADSLVSIPLFNTALVTTIDQMFRFNEAFVSVPLLNTASCTNVSNMFANNYSLREIPELNLSAVSSVANNALALGSTGAGSAAGSLGRAKLTGNKWTQSFQFCLMGATQLDEMYTALATLNPAITTVSGNGTTVTVTVGTGSISPFVVGRSVTITAVDPVAYNISGTVASVNAGAGTFTITNAATGTYVSGGVASITTDRTITVTGNPGVASDTPSIATNKGWTVVG